MAEGITIAQAASICSKLSMICAGFDMQTRSWFAHDNLPGVHDWLRAVGPRRTSFIAGRICFGTYINTTVVKQLKFPAPSALALPSELTSADLDVYVPSACTTRIPGYIFYPHATITPTPEYTSYGMVVDPFAREFDVAQLCDDHPACKAFGQAERELYSFAPSKDMLTVHKGLQLLDMHSLCHGLFVKAEHAKHGGWYRGLPCSAAWACMGAHGMHMDQGSM